MITLLFNYQIYEHIVLSCLVGIGCLLALYVIINVWGRMWNRMWYKDNLAFRWLFPIIWGIFLYPGILIWLSSKSLRDFVVEMRENPEKMHALADKVPSKPGYDVNSYRGILTIYDKEKAEQERGKTEEADERRMLILAKNLNHDKLLIPARSYFTYDTPNAINWKELPSVIKLYIKEIIRSNYVSFNALSNHNGNKLHIQKRNLEKWGAKAMRYLLIRQNIELMLMEERGKFREYSYYSFWYVIIILTLYFIIIVWKACADIKGRPSISIGSVLLSANHHMISSFFL